MQKVRSLYGISLVLSTIFSKYSEKNYPKADFPKTHRVSTAGAVLTGFGRK